MSAPSSRSVAYLLLTATALFWGGNAVAGKFAVGHIPPMTLNAVRWTVAFLLILGLGWPSFRRDWPTVRANLPVLFGLGAVGFSLFNMALYSAAQYTSAVNITIEQAGIPLFVFVTNFLLFRIRVGLAQIFGFVLSLIGVAVVVSGGDIARLAALEINRGDAIVVIAIAAYGVYTVALRYRPVLDWRSTMVAMAFAAMIAAWPLAIWEQLFGGGYMPDARGFAAAAYTAIFPSILSQVFYMRGIEMIGSNRAGLFINLVPVFGTMLAILVLGERLHLFHAIALALVIGGIGLAEIGAARTSKSGR
ncbi:MAG: EamA family transporter [Ahrensia sp.]|nr:EamA family transporter [Ahrensia sp.]